MRCRSRCPSRHTHTVFAVEEAAVLASPLHVAGEGGRGRVGEATPGGRSRPPSGGARGRRREEHEAVAGRSTRPPPSRSRSPDRPARLSPDCPAPPPRGSEVGAGAAGVGG
jgi:hypothetical protein